MENKTTEQNYIIKERKFYWIIEAQLGKLSVSYTVLKKDCPTAEDLRKFLEQKSPLRFKSRKHNQNGETG